MEIIRPEALDPLSFLLTLESVDGTKIAKDKQELAGLDMRTANWQALPQNNSDEISFQYDATEFGLQIVKKFRLAKVDPADIENPTAPAYHLEFAIEVRNVGQAARKVAWRLEGPTGLPLEGAWYATKMSPNWRGGAGMRDVAVGFLVNGRRRTGLVSATTIAEETNPTPWQDEPLEYIGVDAQYFAVALLPEPDHAEDYGRAIPIRVGDVPADRAKLNRTNVSFRLVSKIATIEPGDKTSTETYRIFAGPKRPALLSQYNLGNLVYYGWFGFVAAPMLDVLHFFYRIVPNYGIAIIMLTVLVRSLMFPLSRRQALGAQKMQELQPEIKRIQEKYKGNMEARTKAAARPVPQAQLQSAGRLLAGVLAVADFPGAVSLAGGRRRVARRTIDQRIDPLVLEPGGARHAMALGEHDAGLHLRPQRLAGAVFQYPALLDDRPVHLAAEDVHAPARPTSKPPCSRRSCNT